VGESFAAVSEVCGFNDWLIRMLWEYRYHKVVLIQPDDRKKRKGAGPAGRRPAGDGPPAGRPGAGRPAAEGPGAGARPALGRPPGGRGPVVDAGVGRGLTALSLAGRVGRVDRFPRAHGLANYWGLTPGCRNSGENDQRLGRITKAGGATARWLLAQFVHKAIRRDAGLRDWFRRVKRRRGPTVARVAVMRKRKTYAECREPAAA
jgi:hypothetical protein